MTNGKPLDHPLRLAFDRYWGAQTRVEEREAYLSILHYGGPDGYGLGGWRGWTARMFRRLALWIDQC